MSYAEDCIRLNRHVSRTGSGDNQILNSMSLFLVGSLSKERKQECSLSTFAQKKKQQKNFFSLNVMCNLYKSILLEGQKYSMNIWQVFSELERHRIQQKKI